MHSFAKSILTSLIFSKVSNFNIFSIRIYARIPDAIKEKNNITGYEKGE
jgi:hypothetical protein